MYISVHPDGQPDVTSWMVSTANVSNGYTDESSRRAVTVPDDGDNMTMGQAWDVHLTDGETAIFQKFVGIASTDKFPDAEKTAREESTKAFKDGWLSVISEHEQAWERIMASSRITSYRDPATGRLPVNETLIEKLQIAAVADFFLSSSESPAYGKWVK